MRDKVGSSRPERGCSLPCWIGNYVLLNDAAPQALKAKYPLREARVDVQDVPESLGSIYGSHLFKTALPVEKFDKSIRLVAKLPAG